MFNVLLCFGFLLLLLLFLFLSSYISAWEVSIDLCSSLLILSLAMLSLLMSQSKVFISVTVFIFISNVSFWFFLRIAVSPYITHLSLYVVFLFNRSINMLFMVILNFLFDNSKLCHIWVWIWHLLYLLMVCILLPFLKACNFAFWKPDMLY